MKAVLMNGFGHTDVLYIGETEAPKPKPHELLIKVHATALNRADLLQRMGAYPPPAGASEILGLEMAGQVVEVGAACDGWHVGERVCALLPGGGYAEYAVVPADMAIRLPDGFSYEEGAAIPEVFLTAYLNLMELGRFRAGDTVLVHAGASGVGTAAIQIIREVGGTSFVTAGGEEKIGRCIELGATAGWNYKQGEFAPWVQEMTQGRGVDIIFDFVGAPYFAQNIQSLAVDGRVIIIGTMGGAKVDGVNLGVLLGKRLQVIGTALRSRTPDQKAELTKSFAQFALQRFADGRMKPIIDKVFDWNDVKQAHERMASNQNIGKIVLRVGD